MNKDNWRYKLWLLALLIGRGDKIQNSNSREREFRRTLARSSMQALVPSLCSKKKKRSTLRHSPSSFLVEVTRFRTRTRYASSRRMRFAHSSVQILKPIISNERKGTELKLGSFSLVEVTRFELATSTSRT